MSFSSDHFKSDVAIIEDSVSAIYEIANQINIDKKVLIITYYWPPAGGPGVQRWLKFVKYLPDFGIEPIVYIPTNPSYPIIDNSLQTDVSDKLTIISQPIQIAKRKFFQGWTICILIL